MNRFEMRTNRRLDDQTTDRLLTGAVQSDDAPPGFAAVARLFEHATSFAPVDADSALLTAMAGAVTSAPVPVVPRRKNKMFTELLSAKIAAAAAAVVLSAAGAAAATGTLPDTVQSTVADAVSHVGIDIENPAEDHPTGTADNPTDADEHGDTVSDTARDTDETGAQKGAEISTTARGDHGQARAATGAEDTPAPVDAPNSGGTGTAGTASNGASDTADQHTPDQAGQGATNADDTPADDQAGEGSTSADGTPAADAPYGRDDHPSGRP